MPLRLLLWLIPLMIIKADPPAPQAFRVSGYAQGSSYLIIYYAQEPLIVQDQIEHIFQTLDSSLSLYKPYSLINRFNQSGTGVTADEHFEKVVKRSLEISEITEGTFDISVQALVQAWGFGPEPVSTLPDTATIERLLSCVGKDKIFFEGNHLNKVTPCVKIDLNGIAQGYSVDVIAAFLEQKGIHNYLVEVGGEIRLKGHKPDQTTMAIGIEGPNESSNSPFPLRKIISFEKGAVTTSGSYRKYYQHGGQKISHLIDAQTGFPLQNELISVTVWASDAMTADAYDNALMSMGLQKALAFVEHQQELEAYFIYQTPDGAVADTASKGFYKMIR